MRKAKIGVLAGMGPRTTAPFINLLIDECQNQYDAKNDIDFPSIFAYSLPTPFYVDRPINHRKMLEVIGNGLKELENTGVSFIAMPCNTAHIYYEELARSIRLPLLNIVSESIENLPKSAHRIALLATRFTVEAKIYQKQLFQRGIEVVTTDVWQRRIDELITAVKSAKSMFLVDHKKWNELLLSIADSGIETALVACSDLSVFYNWNETKLTIAEATHSYAKAVIKKWLDY